jgi:hypothetical protein
MASERQPVLTDCPNCRKPLVLLPKEIYRDVEQLTSPELDAIWDTVGGKVDARFTTFDAEQRSTCNWCGETGTLARRS